MHPLHRADKLLQVGDGRRKLYVAKSVDTFQIEADAFER